MDQNQDGNNSLSKMSEGRTWQETEEEEEELQEVRDRWRVSIAG
jgi:hypothetical protein